jgi:hypothetical protein
MRGYLLGEYLQDCDFRDRIMDALIEWNLTAPAVQRATFLSSWTVNAEKHTIKGSPLFKLMADMIIWYMSYTWWISVVDKLPAAFVADVSVGLFTRLRSSTCANALSKGVVHCRYHCHKEGRCYNSK